MKKRIFAAITAAFMLTSATATITPAIYAAGSYDMNVKVDLSAQHKEISPYIYGINDAGYLDDVTVNAVRQGGNRYSAYNWENNYSNAGADWQHSSDTYLTTGYGSELANTPGACAIHLSEDCAENNVPYKMASVQMAGYVSADANGAVSESEAAPSARWKQVKAFKNSELSMTPDKTDDYVYIDEYINYLVNTLGDSTTEGGINGYNLDNEPGLWKSTHPRVHPNGTTYAEMVEKSTEYAKAIKSVDSRAEVYGLALFGVYSYYNLSDAPDADKSYDWFLSYYLDKMEEAEREAGYRLIDAIDVHYYSEAKGDNRVTEASATTDKDIAARVQAPRTLYEDGYREVSWVTDALSNYMPFLPTIQESIDTYYPGTKLAMTEYNFGGGDHVSGAIAQTDALGAFAANDVYLATLWPLSSAIDYQLSAINLYTNYDGKGGAFGDTLVGASTSDVEKGTAYAAIDGNDDSEVTLVLTNKDMTNAQHATISLDGTDTKYSSATVYAITEESSDIRIIDVQNDIKDNKVTIDLPALSVAQIVFSETASDEEITDVPEVVVKEVTYNFSELEKSENGYPMIPIEDAKTLKKVVINADVNCTSGANWIGGGGGLCFNHVVTDDGEVWGSKGFSYSMSKSGNTDMTVNFDGKFSVVDDPVLGTSKEIEATFNDTYMEFQDWWKSSSNDDTGADISVTYNTITLYYETVASAVKGDVNSDGAFDVADIVALQSWLVGASDKDMKNWEAINFCDDDVLNIFDLNLAKRELLKK